MNAARFRELALALPQAEEKSHFGKADFRVRNKIFATLKEAATGVVKLTREQQEMLCAAEPLMFKPIPGGWGWQGWTAVELTIADDAALKSALTMAWGNVAPKSLQAHLVGTGFSPR